MSCEDLDIPIIGWLLQTKALIMIIFVNILLDKSIITSETFTALLLMAVASTMLTVPVVAPKLARMKELILRALQKFNWNQTHAARYLDLSRRTLIYRMEKFGLQKE